MAAPTTSRTRPVRFGVFELDPTAGELRKHGAKIKIEGQPVQVLAMLVERAGELVTREEIQQKLWPADTFVDFERGINGAVKRLRQALDDSADTPRFIETLPRRGYRFIYPVSAKSAEAAFAPTDRRRPKRATLTAFAILLVAVLGVLAASRIDWRNRWWGASRTPIRAIVVLPFENLSGDPGQDYLAAGMTDALTSQLAQVRSLSVPSVTSATHYKGQRRKLRDIARELEVDAAVEGSVRRSGDLVWVNVQLIDARSDRHLWTKLYSERLVTDLPNLQLAVARDIITEVRAEVSAQERDRLARTRVIDPEAYLDYARGREISLGSVTEAAHWKSIEYFQSAIRKEPTYADAYAAMATSYGFLLQLHPNEAMRSQFRAMAQKAYELDPGLGQAHSLLAVLKQDAGELEAAEEAHRRAIELNPSDAMSRLRYAAFLNGRGRHREALEAARRAERLEPTSPYFSANVMLRLNRLQKHDESVAQARKAIDLDPEFWLTHHYLGDTYREMDKLPEAIAAWEKAMSLPGAAERWPLSRLGEAYAASGRMAEARRAVARLEQLNRDNSVEPIRMALTYAAVGRKEDALRMLEVGIAEGPGGRPGGAPLWAAVEKYLGNDVRFQELRARRQQVRR